jgi:hypothetical protein
MAHNDLPLKPEQPKCFTSKVWLEYAGTVVRGDSEIKYANHDTKGS